MLEMDCLKGKKVVLTGAYGVFGKWFTKAFNEVGAQLCLTGRRMDKLEELAASMDFAFPPLLVQADLTRDADLEKLVETVRKEWKAPDAVVANAGLYPSAFLLETETAEWDRIMNVNVRSTFILTRDMAKLMISERVKGCFVYISSGAARILRAKGIPYCVSKGAESRLCTGFALELAHAGIRVNAVEPGFAPGSETSPLEEGYVKKMISGIPLGRSSGPTDAASAVLYLCSDWASFITGTSIAVDGGNSCGQYFVEKQKFF